MQIVLDRQTALLRCVGMGLITAQEIFEDVWTVEERASRNMNFAVVNQRGSGFFLKSQREFSTTRAEAIAREFGLCEAGGRLRQLARHLPRAVAWDARSTTAVYRLIRNGENGSAYFYEHGLEHGIALIKSAARTVAECHIHLGRAVRFAARNLDLVRSRPSCFIPHTLTRSDATPPSRGQLALLDYLYLNAPLIAALDTLGRTWTNDGLIHGDVKLANFSFLDEQRNLRCMLLDWESVGFGDTAWDPAGLVQSILSLWAQTVDGAVRPGDGIQAENLRTVRAAVRQALSEYGRRVGLRQADRVTFEDKCMRFAAARLVQTCYEQSKQEERLTGQVALQISIVEELLMEPEGFLADEMGQADGAR